MLTQATEPVEEPICHLLRLPVELRLMIYRYLLCPPIKRIQIHHRSDYGRTRYVTYKGEWDLWWTWHVHSAILRTNRQIQQEAYDVLYGEVKFIFHLSTLSNTSGVGFWHEKGHCGAPLDILAEHE